MVTAASASEADAGATPILDRRLVFVTGKGGVGKTSIASALALLAAREGRRVLVCEMDAKGSLATAFDAASLTVQPRELEPGLWAMAMNTEDSLREYLRLFPDGTSPDNAQFWIGKIHLDQGQHEEAVRELERLLAEYPETDKAAQATFYLGNANRALGNEERARAYYRDVIDRYPASQESQLARRELDR